MKKVVAIVLLYIMVFQLHTLISTRVNAQISLPWRDEFDYQDTHEMKDFGWSIEDESMIDIGGGLVTLDNDGAVGCTIYFDGQFPSGVLDFEVETKGMWIGRSYGTLQVVAMTERHVYCWMLDGYYPEYVFHRDEVKVLRFRGYTPQKDV